MKKLLSILAACCAGIALLLSSCPLDSANLIGPAGGYVFYDKGGYSDGWRYLEAAPDDAGEGDWDHAGQRCEDYRLGGYGGWRLPDVDELQALLSTGGGKHYGGGQEVQSKVFWSGEEDKDDPSKAWAVGTIEFTVDEGKTTTNSKGPAAVSKTREYVAWPVRPF